ncbi:tetratricopeptide repeat protein, partial [Gemmatimonadota bacterium]
RLDSAERVLERFIVAHPERPCGYYFRATATSWRLFLIGEDEDPEPLKEKFGEQLEISRKAAEEAAKIDSTRFEGTLYLGAVYGQQALLAMIDHRWLVMAPPAKRSWNYIEKAQKIDPDFYDCYMGRGIYLYITDALPEVVRLLALAYGFEGDKTEGLANIWLAASRGLYSRDASRMVLMNIYSSLQEPNERIMRTAQSLRERYPDNPMIHWRLGDLLLRDKQFTQARETFEEVARKIESGYPYYDNRMFSEWSMAYRIALCDKKMGEFDSALRGFESITAADSVHPRWIVPSANLELGRIYLMKNEFVLAEQALRRVLDGKDYHGNHDQAKELIKQIEKRSGM